MYLLKKFYEIESNPVIDEVKYYTKRGCMPIHTVIKNITAIPNDGKQQMYIIRVPQTNVSRITTNSINDGLANMINLLIHNPTHL